MNELLAIVQTLLMTLGAFVLPGWPLARRLSPDTIWPGSFVLSLATLFSGSLILSAAGGRISWLSLAPFQAILFAGGWWWNRRAGSTPAPAAPTAPAPRWSLALAGVVGVALAVRAWQQPLLGYDTSFRWDRLARVVFASGSLAGYPARTPADYSAYFYPDAVPPLVSLAYAEIYSLVGRVLPAATAGFIVLQGGLIAVVAVQLARAFSGPAAGHAALLAIGATPLLFWCVLMGQETGLTAFSLGALLLWLERSAATGRRADAALAGIAAGLGAASREYGGAFFVVGLLAAGWLRLGRPHLGLYCGAAALIAAPWYLRVWSLTGNPFYPLKVGALFPYNHVHESMFAELRQHFAWSVLPWRERLRAIGQLLQLAPVAVCAGAWGLWQLRRRAPGLAIGVLGTVALWLWGMGVVAGGTYISLRMLSPALLLLSVASGVALASSRHFQRTSWIAGGIALLSLPNLLTLPLMAKSVPPAQWWEGLRAAGGPPPAITPGEKAILDLPGKILTDDPYVHSWIANRGAGAKVVPVWSDEFSFLFEDALPPEAQLARLHAAGVRTVVLWPNAIASSYLLRQPWTKTVRATWTEVAPGYFHDGAAPSANR